MNKPKEIKSVWDNGGESLDRYAIILKEQTTGKWNWCIYSCHQPTHPQGVSGWTGTVEGKHLGERIKWADLPGNVQEFVVNQLK